MIAKRNETNDWSEAYVVSKIRSKKMKWLGKIRSSFLTEVFPWICSKQMQLFPLLYLPPRNLPFVCSLNTHRRLFIDSRSSFEHEMGSKREINASGHKSRLERQIYAWNVHASTGSDASKYADSSIRIVRVSVHGS